MRSSNSIPPVVELLDLTYYLQFLDTVINGSSMCSLAVSTLDSPAVDPRSNPGSGKILMSENFRLYTTSPVGMC